LTTSTALSTANLNPRTQNQGVLLEIIGARKDIEIKEIKDQNFKIKPFFRAWSARSLMTLIVRASTNSFKT
jgi:hypothetical protein